MFVSIALCEAWSCLNYSANTVIFTDGVPPLLKHWGAGTLPVSPGGLSLLLGKSWRRTAVIPPWGPSALDWKCWWVRRKREGTLVPCFCPSLNPGSKLRCDLPWSSKGQVTSLTMCFRDYQYHHSVRGMEEEFQYSVRLKQLLVLVPPNIQRFRHRRKAVQKTLHSLRTRKSNRKYWEVSEPTLPEAYI